MESIATKRCPMCGTDLPVSSFGIARTRKDGLAGYCKPCMRTHRNDHYKSNSGPYKARAVERRTQMRDFLAEYKNKPCMDCGGSFPSFVMDLDHRPGVIKLCEPSKLPNMGNWDALHEEISKCDVVCSNCHRVRTYERANG